MSKNKLLVAFEIPYSVIEGGAHVDFPPYFRAVPEVFNRITAALSQHGLDLRHINITSQHKAEIEAQQQEEEALKNVLIEDPAKDQGTLQAE